VKEPSLAELADYLDTRLKDTSDVRVFLDDDDCSLVIQYGPEDWTEDEWPPFSRLLKPIEPEEELEVLRMRLPIPVRAMDQLAGLVEAAYGRGMRMTSTDDQRWLVITRS